MNIGVLADIHGNYVALQTCIDYALEKGVDAFLFLGDYVGELAYPERAMAMLYDLKEKYPCTFIRGNKENYWIDYRANQDENYQWIDQSSTTGMLLYAYQHLSDQDIDFFDTLPIFQTIVLPEQTPFIICHGSPTNVREKMMPGSEPTHKILESLPTDLIICGHTHRQYHVNHQGKTLLNPGSIGVPLGSNGKTQFLILHSTENGWQEEFISLDYDVETVISDMRADRLDTHAPYWHYATERLLRDGKTSTGIALNKAMALCKAETGECRWPHIPEKYWQQAVSELYPQ